MILGSHNSWSYLPLTKWWMKPFAFMAKCQDYNIKQQYELCGVRCFDLRIKFNKDGNLVIAHGNAIYKYTRLDLEKDLYYLSNKGDCYVRVLHEIRNKKEHTDAADPVLRLFHDVLVLLLRARLYGIPLRSQSHEVL